MTTQKNTVQAAQGAKPVQTNREKMRGLIATPEIAEMFKQALGKNAGAFLTSIIEIYNGDAKLQLCNPGDVIREAMKAATLGLPLSKALGMAYIIPYDTNKKQLDGTWKKVVTPNFQLGYRGILNLCQRSGRYTCINDGPVYEGELRGFDKLSGEIDLSGERTSDKVIGYFAYIRLNNGFTKTFYATVKQIAEHAKKFSKGLAKEVSVDTLVELVNKPADPNAKQSVGWLGNFEAMARKTCLLQVTKYTPKSIDELQIDAIVQGAEQAGAQAYDEAMADYQEVEEVVNEPQAVAETSEATAPAPQPKAASRPAPVNMAQMSDFADADAMAANLFG